MRWRECLLRKWQRIYKTERQVVSAVEDGRSIVARVEIDYGIHRRERSIGARPSTFDHVYARLNVSVDEKRLLNRVCSAL